MSITGQARSALIQQDAATSSLDLSKYTGHVKDLMQPNPVIYWTDFLLSNIAGDVLIFFAVRAEPFSVLQMVCMFMAAVFLFRAAVFVHEDNHLGKRIKGFSLAFNLVYGFLHKLPSYTYGPHKYHHLEKTFGTLKDPEYDVLADKPAYALLIPVVSMLLVPGFLVVRYGFLPALLPFLGERGRKWIYTHASTFVMNLEYKREQPTEDEVKEWYRQDLGCFLYNAVFFSLMAVQVLPWKLFWVWYLVFYGVYMLNFYRVIANHGYVTAFKPTTYKQQILDSTTLEVSPVFNEWWCPVGLRYHALHHMYLSIPYHNLGKAHKRLLDILPADHPYRRTLRKSYFDAIKGLIKPSKVDQQAVLLDKES
jgi:fatty acid desaturase